MPEKDTILYVITKSQEFLKSKGVASPRLDAELLLADQLGLERIKLYSNFDRKLSEEEKDQYRIRIKRRGLLEPVAYILGKKYFYKSIFTVNSSVLIPRPETEELVEWILSENSLSSRSVLDLGTGSGCIAISLKKERPDWNIHALDNSREAIDIARQNAQDILENNFLEFFESNWYQELPEFKYNILVSNPPYIPFTEKDRIMDDVLKYEPHSALFLEKPSEFYSMFIENSKKFLESNGKIYLEIHPDWVDVIQEIAAEHGFKIQIKQDYSKKNRMVRINL